MPGTMAARPSEFKNTATISEQMAAARLNRKRAPKACLACRARKVRCDVVVHGAPCTNCRLDGDECVVKERPKT
jgi:hypothetical protein